MGFSSFATGSAVVTINPVAPPTRLAEFGWTTAPLLSEAVSRPSHRNPNQIRIHPPHQRERALVHFGIRAELEIHFQPELDIARTHVHGPGNDTKRRTAILRIWP